MIKLFLTLCAFGAPLAAGASVCPELIARVGGLSHFRRGETIEFVGFNEFKKLKYETNSNESRIARLARLAREFRSSAAKVAQYNKNPPAKIYRGERGLHILTPKAFEAMPEGQQYKHISQWRDTLRGKLSFAENKEIENQLILLIKILEKVPVTRPLYFHVHRRQAETWSTLAVNRDRHARALSGELATVDTLIDSFFIVYELKTPEGAKFRIDRDAGGDDHGVETLVDPATFPRNWDKNIAQISRYVEPTQNLSDKARGISMRQLADWQQKVVEAIAGTEPSRENIGVLIEALNEHPLQAQ